MKVQIFQVPYDSGHRSLRMGRGPEHFVQNDLQLLLRDVGYDVSIECIDARSSFQAEIKTAFELYRLLSERVNATYTNGIFPLVLSGNCNSSLGTVAGINVDQLGVIWFDSHGDFNTPETTESGFLDGMGLATVAGLCWKKMAASIPNFKPVSGSKILHIGGRDFSDEEKSLFDQSGGTIVSAQIIRQLSVQRALLPALESLRSRTSKIYLHFDLDVLDPQRTPANEFAAPNGLTVEQLEEAIQMIGDRFMICAAGIAAYDPSYDKESEVLSAGVTIMKRTLATH